LEGHRWAQLGKSAARHVCVRPSGRSATTLLLVLFLLAPYGSSFFLLLGRDNSTCGMQCCKRSKVCCCRKSGHNAHEDGPAWASSSKCPGGCGQVPAVQGATAASLSAARFQTVPVVITLLVRRASDPMVLTSDVVFALFERPPPIPA